MPGADSRRKLAIQRILGIISRVSPLRLWVALGLWCLLLCRSQAAVLVSDHATWRMLYGTGEASWPDVTEWRAASLDDLAWPEVTGPFYADADPNPATAYTGRTALSEMPGNFSSLFLRGDFFVQAPATLDTLELRVRAADGFILWINGREAVRFNLPEGAVPYNGVALRPVTKPAAEQVFILTNAVAWVLPGTNVLAAQAFSADPAGRAPFLFSATMSAASETQPPTVDGVEPAADQPVADVSSATVTFSEPVQGVDAADLLVNGHPATSVVVLSPRQYEFHFDPLPLGLTQFAWTPLHGITDLADPANSFAGFAWSLQVVDYVPPRTVVISEFLTDNTTGIRDEDGSRNDWIELWNLGKEAMSLEGWYLTDTELVPTRWKLPAIDLPAGGYRLIWASGKDRRDPAAPLHTNFKLPKEGGYLALLDARTNVLSAFAPYPTQQPNVSYGRDSASPELTGYYATPTPGTNNAVRGPGIAGEVSFSLPAGVYTNSTLSIALTAPSGEIRYTVNGTMPTNTSLIYTGAFTISSSLTVKARVFENGKLPGVVAAQPYTLISASTRDFNSNLPLLVIATGSVGIGQDARVKASIMSFEPRNGRARLQAPPDYLGPIQIEVRGQSSTSFPKLAYNVELDDAYGNDVEVPLLGLPAESDWALYNPYTEKCFMNNVLAYELYRQMGHYAPRTKFVEVFVDTNGGKVEYPRDYMGIYVLVEKIKIDNHRLDLARLTPSMTNDPAISGGYIIKKDKDSPGDRGFTSIGGNGFSGQALKYHEPKPREINRAQETWIRNYINAFERSLYATNWLTRTGTNHYASYIDVDTFVDYHWMVEFAKQIDGYRLSDYFNKDRNGKLKIEPIWDWNLAFGNADYLNGWLTNGWYYNQIGENDHIWLRRLMCGTSSASRLAGDPDFNQRIIDRWGQLRTNILSTNRLVARIEELAAYLNEAQARDFAKWPRLSAYVWPNPSFYITSSYRQIINALEKWVMGRAAWIDTQFTRTPILSRPAGLFSPGTQLEISATNSIIYYTLDGTDPRAPGGSNAPSAQLYSGPLTLTTNVAVTARAYRFASWGAPVQATYWVKLPDLRITEVMFHPAAWPGLTNAASAFEFVELWNASTETVDLTGMHFTNAIRFSFTGSAVNALAPGERLVVVRDRAAFTTAHPEVPRVAGEFQGSLGNGGEAITLLGAAGETVAEVRYQDSWYPLADGPGFSLVPSHETDAAADWTSPTAWRASAQPGGSPGLSDTPPLTVPRVVVSEALTHTDPPQLDSIELQNLAADSADISGWLITDDPQTPFKFPIPSGTVLAPGGRVVFTETDFQNAFGGPFRFSSLGDQVYLYSATTNGVLTGWRHGFAFGASANGVSFGRTLTSDGVEWFLPEQSVTLGTSNAGPRIGPVVLNEIMFHPAPDGTNSDTLNEFIELRNLTDASIPLFDPAHPTNTWRLRGGVSLDFPPGLVLPPHGLLILVGFEAARDPLAVAGFRAKYGASTNLSLIGPWSGHLDNAGDTLRLEQPDPPQGATAVDPGFVPYTLVDATRFSPDAPWPQGAAGSGLSLQRRLDTALSEEPRSWATAPATPGFDNDRVGPDQDQDGLPDDWETLHHLNPARPDGVDGAAGDPDNDGMDNWHEFLAGTDPRSADSVLRLEAHWTPGGGIALRYAAGPARVYQIQYRDSLGNAAWKTLHQAPAQPQARFVEVTDSLPGAGVRFYRLVVPGS